MKEFSYVVLHQRNFDFTTLEEIEPANIRNKIRRSQAFCLQRIFTGIINMTDSCHVELDMIGMEYEKR